MNGWHGRKAVALTRLCLETYGRDCHLCGGVGIATTADHVIARNRGGSNAIENLRPACGPCNSARGDMDLAEWFRRHPIRSRLSEPSRRWYGLQSDR